MEVGKRMTIPKLSSAAAASYEMVVDWHHRQVAKLQLTPRVWRSWNVCITFQTAEKNSTRCDI
jgi:hypothetical protein